MGKQNQGFGTLHTSGKLPDLQIYQILSNSFTKKSANPFCSLKSPIATGNGVSKFLE